MLLATSSLENVCFFGDCGEDLGAVLGLFDSCWGHVRGCVGPPSSFLKVISGHLGLVFGHSWPMLEQPCGHEAFKELHLRSENGQQSDLMSKLVKKL